MPARVQRFRLRLMKFNYNIYHVPGKQLSIADALSRPPVSQADIKISDLAQQAELYLIEILQNVPASEKRLNEIRTHLEEDDVCAQVMQYCRNGWPDRSQLKGSVKLYCPFVDELNVQDGLLFRGTPSVIPQSIILQILDKLYVGNRGIVRCRERARHSLWSPGLNSQFGELVGNCSVCRKHARTELYPWTNLIS